MIRFEKIAWIAAGLLFAAVAWAHPATERYIPIGESPGVSGIKSYVGTIRSVDEVTRTGLTMRLGAEGKVVKVDRETMIYLQKVDPRKSNTLGSYADCEAGRLAEAYLADDGTAIWVKIQVQE